MITRLWHWLTSPAQHTTYKPRLSLEQLEDREVPATLVGLTTANQLVSIPSDFPNSSFAFSTPITGLTGGERVVGIDFRPRTGQLYALAVDGNGSGTNGRLLTLDGFAVTGQPSTITATHVGTFTIPVASPDASYGFDFNPTVDAVRVVNSADANFRLNPDTAAILGTDPAINPAGQGIDAVAYDRNFDGQLGINGTTLYVINATTGTLQTQGGLNQVPSPNSGTLIPIGALGVAIDPTRPIAFDIQANAIAGQGPAFAVFDGDVGAGIATGLYSINLTTGAATFLGLVRDGSFELSGLAVVPESSIALGVKTLEVTSRTSPPTEIDSFARLLVQGITSPTARPGFPNTITPFVGYRGALATAVADVNRDAIPDLVVAAATAGNNGHVKVFSGVDGSLLMSFFAFQDFAGGVLLAAGDVGGGAGGAADGFGDVVVVAASGGNGHVKAVSGADGSLIGSFFAFPGFMGPVSVAVSDLDLDRVLFRDEIVVAAGSNGHVRAFNFDGTSFGGVSFFAFEGFFGPVNLAGGDVNGDGIGDIVAGASAASGHVKVFSGRAGNPLTLSFLTSPIGGVVGISVGTTDVNRDGRLEIAVAPLSGGVTSDPIVQFFDGLTGVRTGVQLGGGGLPGAANSGAYVSGGRA